MQLNEHLTSKFTRTLATYCGGDWVRVERDEFAFAGRSWAKTVRTRGQTVLPDAIFCQVCLVVEGGIHDSSGNSSKRSNKTGSLKNVIFYSFLVSRGGIVVFCSEIYFERSAEQ